MVDGGWPFEIALGLIGEWRGARCVGIELFDPGDEAGLLTRFAQFATFGGNLIAQLYARHCAAFNARDWPAVVADVADDFVLVDRRPVTPWPVLRGRAEVEVMWRDLLTMGEDARLSFEFVEGDDESAIVRYGGRGHAVEGGGEFEIIAGNVAIQRRGCFAYGEVFDPDDLETMRTRRDELRPLARRRPGTDLPAEPLPIEHQIMRIFAALDAQDWDSAAATLAPGMHVVDHRATSGEVSHRAVLIAGQRALADNLVHLERHYEVIAATDTAGAVLVTVCGSRVDGGGPFAQALGAVLEWHGEFCVRVEFFDPQDEAGLVARFEELAAGSRL